MYSSLRSLTAKSWTAGRICSSQGASSRRAASVKRGRLGEPAGQLEQGRGRRRQVKLHGQRDRAEVEERQLAARRPGERQLSRQGDAGRLELDPDRRRPVADRFRRAPPPGQLARLALKDQPGSIEVDLVADVEGERQVNRGGERLRHPGPARLSRIG